MPRNAQTPHKHETDDAQARRSGQTTTRKDGDVAPRLPHERDESTDSQVGGPREVMEQAHRDVDRGLVDTDRGPVLDDAYQKVSNGRRPAG
jgi:hypothetical protein